MLHRLTLSRSRQSACEPTPNVLAIAQMFGIGADERHEVVLYQNLEIAIAPRRIVYITGESGAGKTSLLQDIRQELTRREAHVMALREVGSLPDRPVIDLFEPKDLRGAMRLLTFAGLSEPFVMLRRPRELSDGQRYRLALALALLDAELVENPVIVMDEFLANLDRETARAVAYQTRKAASGSSLCFVVATTHQDIVQDLNADTRVTMRLGRTPELVRRVV